MDEVENSLVMQRLWTAYQKKFSYAADVDWKTVMLVVKELIDNRIAQLANTVAVSAEQMLGTQNDFL